MIIYENIEKNLVRAYSDKHVKIHGGNPESDYDEAIDPADLKREYTETDIPIETEDATIDDYKQALTELGVELDEEA